MSTAYRRRSALGPDVGPIKGVTEGASSVLADAFDLAELQTQLAVEDAKSFGRTAKLAMVGAVFSLALLIAALPVVAIGLAQWLSWAVEWPVWTCQLIVGFVLIAMGIVTALWCLNRLRHAFQEFNSTRREAAENIRWLRQAVSRTFTV